MDYKDFKKEDFLKDEFFIQWIKKGNPEANHFWDSWLESHPEKLTEIQNAREIVEKIGYGKKAHIDQILYNDVLESIYRDENFQYRLEYGRKSVLVFIDNQGCGHSFVSNCFLSSILVGLQSISYKKSYVRLR